MGDASADRYVFIFPPPLVSSQSGEGHVVGRRRPSQRIWPPRGAVVHLPVGEPRRLNVWLGRCPGLGALVSLPSLVDLNHRPRSRFMMGLDHGSWRAWTTSCSRLFSVACLDCVPLAAWGGWLARAYGYGTTQRLLGIIYDFCRWWREEPAL